MIVFIAKRNNLGFSLCAVGNNVAYHFAIGSIFTNQTFVITCHNSIAVRYRNNAFTLEVEILKQFFDGQLNCNGIGKILHAVTQNNSVSFACRQQGVIGKVLVFQRQSCRVAFVLNTDNICKSCEICFPKLRSQVVGNILVGNGSVRISDDYAANTHIFATFGKISGYITRCQVQVCA